MRKLTTEEFIEKAKKVHGERYDYSKFVYAGRSGIGIILCPEHGSFEQTSREHLNGCRMPHMWEQKSESFKN